MSNYARIWGLRRSIYSDDESIEPILSEEGIRIEELYFERNSGNIEISFHTNERLKIWERSLVGGGYIRIEHSERHDETRGHFLSIPVKASKNWNAFVESLPEWEADQ